MPNKTGVTIRRATAGDQDVLAAVYVVSWLSGHPNEAVFEELESSEQERLLDEARDMLEGYLDGGDSRVWMADCDGEPAGLVQRGSNRAGGVHLRLLYVAPKFQHLGLGRQLLTAALQGLPAGTRVTLEVARDAVDAVALYHTWGFVEAGSLEPSPILRYPDGEEVPAIIMQKEV